MRTLQKLFVLCTASVGLGQAHALTPPPASYARACIGFEQNSDQPSAEGRETLKQFRNLLVPAQANQLVPPEPAQVNELEVFFISDSLLSFTFISSNSKTYFDSMNLALARHKALLTELLHDVPLDSSATISARFGATNAQIQSGTCLVSIRAHLRRGAYSRFCSVGGCNITCTSESCKK
jgi:hypothetical protein